MTDRPMAIVATTETIFFGKVDDVLRQWVGVTISNPSDGCVGATVVIEAGGESVSTSLDLRPGVAEYRCHAPVLWPDRSAEPRAVVRLIADGVEASAEVSVGTHRPWTIYVLSDACTDYTWVYDNTQAVHADDAAITEAELNVAEATVDGPESDHNHYNMVHARELEFYLEQYPDKAGRLLSAVQDGTIGFNPFYNMCMTNDLTLEELIRHFYPARRWAEEHDLDLGYANHQETPTITWAAATVLANSGVGHLVKSILPYECPWAERLDVLPVHYWEGPDGSRVLVRLRNGDYVEARFLLRDLRSTVTALHDSTIPYYEELADRYPFDAIGLVGCYGDLAPNSRDLAAKKSATVAAYNAHDWEYPKLVNASHKQFWDDIDAQIAERAPDVPVVKGDYGTSWEAWPVSLAYDFAGWRRAQERARVADKLSSILSRRDAEWYEAHREQLEQGWMNTIYLADHAWNGANDVNRALNARLRREWQVAANSAFDAVIDDGLCALAAQIPAEEEGRFAVFNGLGWPRSGVVRIPGENSGAAVVDVETGDPVASQVALEDGKPVLCFEARDVPSVGYRVFELQSDRELPAGPEWVWDDDANTLEGPLYRVTVSQVTGGIESLFDKVRGRELVDDSSPYHVNQCLYFSDGIEYTPSNAVVRLGECGAVSAQVVVETGLKNTSLRSIITLYAHLDRVDIRNELEKIPTSEKQELDFAFPFRVSDRQYRFEAPGAIITPGDDQVPGAGQAVTAVRHFVDTFNDEFGVILSQADSAIVEFGHRTTLEDPLRPDPNNSTILALAMANCIDWDEIIRDQAGNDSFVYRYSLCGHAGGFDPVSAVRFGWEDNNELLAVPLTSGQNGELPEQSHSFLEVSPDHVVLAGFKVAEENGLIVRLWECAGTEALARVSTHGLGVLSRTTVTDLLERDKSELTLMDDVVEVSVPALGIATVRLVHH
ncbi:MAG: hypothetical protein GX620_11270 [Chloroflexi bacterium]|nr:hypothetical protein [Chloroflexota bacterium]